MKSILSVALFLSFSITLFSQGVINVKNYGAKGDGSADDTKAIQSAIDAANPLVKTTVFFPAGTYNIGSYTTTPNYLENYSLLMHSNLNFKGDGDQSVIRIPDHVFDKTDVNANAHLFYGSKMDNISFSGLLIDMNGENNLVPLKIIKNHSAVFAKGGSNFTFDNITIKNCPGTNMLNLMGSGKGLVIENCKFINGGNYVGSSTPNKNQYDFSFIYSEWDNTVLKNSIIQQENIDISLANFSGGIELHGSNTIATGNTIEGCWPAMFVTSNMGDMLENVTIENNKLINCSTGISFWLIKPMKNIFIKNNEISITYSRTPKLTVCAGIIMPNGNEKEYSIRKANNSMLSNLEIDGNTISADITQNMSAGIIIHSLQQSEIKNNVIIGMNYGGLIIAGSKWGINSLEVENNTFKDFMANNNANTVAAYVIITDTYSPGVSNAPGFKGIVFNKNSFLNNGISATNKGAGKGKFFGAFIALPSQMMDNIQFNNNDFSDPHENIKKVITN